MGKSGCGKTTLLRILGGIDKETSGKVEFKGREISKLNSNEIAKIRRNEIGFVFQDFYLMDSLTAKENIMLPMILDKKSINVIDKVVNSNAKRFNIDKILDKYPYELSGGEKQRVAICRSLSNNPNLILADEPTGNLDSISSDIVINYFKIIHSELNKTIIVVTHDPFIASFCNRVLFMKDGEIIGDILKEFDINEFFNSIINKIPCL